MADSLTLMRRIEQCEMTIRKTTRKIFELKNLPPTSETLGKIKLLNDMQNKICKGLLLTE